MKKSVLQEKLSKGFNTAIVAELCACSIGRINELKREIDYEFIATKYNINIDDLKNDIQNHINVNAIFAFCDKHEIDVEEWDEETIEKACSLKERVKSEGIKIEVGTILPNGEKIVKIQKNGNQFNYIADNYNVYSQKQIIAIATGQKLEN